MQGIRLGFSSFVIVMVLASAAMAQAQRTFVSGLGNDGNPCTRTAPCRNFAPAVSQTSAGGEVVVLDSAGYGAFSITRSVSIIAPRGVYAGISVFSGDGIDINAGSSDTVILRGLTINNRGSSGNGISITGGQNFHIESCVVNAFANGSGVSYTSANAAGTLEVKDSIIGGNLAGIFIFPQAVGSGFVLAAIDHVRLEMNLSSGLEAEDGAKVTIRNSIATGNNIGFFASASFAASAEINIENCVASNNAAGISAFQGASQTVTIRVSNSTVTDNSIGGFVNNGGVFLSRGSNTVEGNTSNTIGTIGSYSAK